MLKKERKYPVEYFEYVDQQLRSITVCIKYADH